MKTPEEIAHETWGEGTGFHASSGPAIVEMMKAAVEIDRAQRFNAADMQVLFDVAESGIARELGALDVRHQYNEGEIESMMSRWAGARAAITALREVLA